jgi:inosine-uridine nucleoside N-ribohydrolase
MKFIFDNDFIGPGGTALQAALMCATLPPEQLLGFTCVAGDDDVSVGAHELLRFLKLIGRTDIPVALGAARPLLNTPEATQRWEAVYGKLPWRGKWNSPLDHTQGNDFRAHAGEKVEGTLEMHAAMFLIECARRHPGDLTIICGGPMTNVALACRLDPDFARNVSIVVSNGPTHNLDRVEAMVSPVDSFNFIFDPEAAYICLSEQFASVLSVGTVTPGSDMTEAMRDRFDGESKLEAYLHRHAWVGLPMWDELTVALVLWPEILTRSMDAWMTVDIGPGASRGRSIVFADRYRPQTGAASVRIALDYDRTAFEDRLFQSVAKFA